MCDNKKYFSNNRGGNLFPIKTPTCELSMWRHRATDKVWWWDPLELTIADNQTGLGYFYL